MGCVKLNPTDIGDATQYNADAEELSEIYVMEYTQISTHFQADSI